jgi:hypothetical protein
MYGFSGYGTNSYGSKRQSAVLAPARKLVSFILQNTYNLGMTLQLQFRKLILSNPQNNSSTLEL